MYIDIICLALMSLLFVLGLISGFLSQVIKIAALVAACLLASPLSPYAKELLMKKMEVDSLFGDMLSLFLAWLASYVVLIIVGSIIARIIRGSSKSLKFLDRVLGGALGALKGALIVYLVVCAILMFREPLESIVPSEYLDLEESQVAAFAKDNNILTRLDLPSAESLKEIPAARNLGEIVNALGNEEQKEALARDPGVKKILRTPAFQKLKEDPELLRAVSEKDFSAILQNENVRRVFNDPEIRKLLSEVDLESIQGMK